MEKEIKVTENTVKQVLENRVVELTSKIWEHSDALDAHMNLKATEFFKEVLVDFPEVSIKVYRGGESLYFKIGTEEILSINERGYEVNVTYYLNTYSTWIESEFEFRRLIFNGRIAALIYKNGWETSIKEFFVPDEFMIQLKAQVRILNDEKWELEKEISKINNAQKEATQKEILEKFLSGQEVHLNSPTTIYYKSGRHDSVRCVTSFKVLKTSSTGKKVDVEFTTVWGTHPYPDVPLKNLMPYLTTLDVTFK